MRTRRERFRAAADAEQRADDARRAIRIATENDDESATARAEFDQAIAELQDIDREDR